MALDPTLAADLIWLAYRDVAGLDAEGKPAPDAPAGDYVIDWPSAYDTYAEQGIVLGADNSGGNTAILTEFFRGGVGNDAATITRFATALAEYWSTVAVSPGIPAHGGSVVISVSNSAMACIQDFEAAILASLSSVESKPYWLHFIENVQNIAVSKIIWTVTELVGGSPATFSEVIA